MLKLILNQQGRMGIKAACIMMQKNETFLLKGWIDYYSYLFGGNNLYIFDNGSTHNSILRLLSYAEGKGAHVYRNYNTYAHFTAKGTIFADLIQRLDSENPYDFYFPLDCDEFMAVEDREGRSCLRKRIFQELEPLKGEMKVLTISSKYYHTPFQKNLYTRLAHVSTTKCFFARGSCASLDHGFHRGKSLLGQQQVKTKIIYYEFHRKPFLEFRRSSCQKISGLVPDFSRATLTSYFRSKKSNFHCAGELLHSKYEYYRLCQKEARIADIELLTHLDNLAIDYTQLFEKSTRVPLSLRILTLRLRHNGLKVSILLEMIGKKLAREFTKLFQIAKGFTN